MTKSSSNYFILFYFLRISFNLLYSDLDNNPIVIDNALYSVLFLDYLKSAFPVLGGGVLRILALIVLTVVLTYMNYRGLSIVGWLAVILGISSLLPFVVMGIVAYPKLEPSRWLEINLHEVDWNLYLHTLFWNLNYWDSINTVIGEVNNPKKTLP